MSRGVHILLLLALASPACKSSRREVSVFAAASLARALSDLEERVEATHRDLDVRLEISGSQVACRKIAELNRRGDVVAVADYQVIDSILRPAHATFNIHFSTNEVVLAHQQHSRFTEQISADNWHQILLRPAVRLARVDPNLAPIGYRTLLVWQLARRQLGDRVPADLATKLAARCAKEHVVPHEGQLLQLLQTRAVDYVFLYRSTAEEHNLKTVSLPDSYNLGATKHNRAYRQAAVAVRMRHGDRGKLLRGAAVVYGVTIPNNAPNPAGAEAFVRALLGAEGRRSLQRTGFRPLLPARCAERALLPPSLRSLVGK